MFKVKPLTLAIFALLLILLGFNFVPKDSKNPPKQTHKKLQENAKENSQEIQRLQSAENNATLKQTSAELIRKNIEILQQNIAILQQENAQQESALRQESLQDSSDSNLTQSVELALESKERELQKDASKKIEESLGSKCVRHKPQLAIIIDDISSFVQYQAVLRLTYKVTPSIFPQSKFNKDAQKIAKSAPFFMVHLPLEALNFYQKEHKWLYVGDSKEKIEDYITKIKRDFPHLTYINNHTGSKFTQDARAMTLLLETLAAHKINFVDSRTIANTYTSAFYAEHREALLNPCQRVPLVRDVFLDNTLEIPQITQNLIQAVKIARDQGYAIAIAHPHRETLLALRNATDYLRASGVELVYVNEIIAP